MNTTARVFSIFHELNKIPRPSHHEERVADYLCQFAERLHLEYELPPLVMRMQNPSCCSTTWTWCVWE